jgi:hypothetical protein
MGFRSRSVFEKFVRVPHLQINLKGHGLTAIVLTVVFSWAYGLDRCTASASAHTYRVTWPCQISRDVQDFFPRTSRTWRRGYLSGRSTLPWLPRTEHKQYPIWWFGSASFASLHQDVSVAKTRTIYRCWREVARCFVPLGVGRWGMQDEMIQDSMGKGWQHI